MINRRQFSQLAALVLSSAVIPEISVFPQDSKPLKTNPTRQYAVVVSESTYKSEGWKKVVDALQSKYPETRVHVYKESITELQVPLKNHDPTHIAYVAKPEEITIRKLGSDEGKEFDGRVMQEDLAEVQKSGVGQFHKMLYDMGNGYPTAIGGIITGESPTDALRIAQARPMTIRRGLLKTMAEEWVPAFSDYALGFSDGRSDEGNGKESLKVYENKNGKTEKSRAETAGARFFETLSNENVDLVIVNGHASDHDWKMGYGYPDDSMIIDDKGRIVMINPERETRGAIKSKNQKIFWSPGSCQLGRIKEKDKSLVLALMRQVGVVQHFGYANNTWHGFVGGGLRDPLITTTEHPTFFESLHMSRIAAAYSQDQLKQRRESENLEFGLEEFGKKYDLAAFVGFGDPALDARMDYGLNFTPDLEKKVTRDEKGLTLSLVAQKDSNGCERPVVFTLPRGIKLKETKATKGLVHKLIGDRYVIFDVGRELVKTESGELKYEMRPLKKDTRWTLEIIN